MFDIRWRGILAAWITLSLASSALSSPYLELDPDDIADNGLATRLDASSLEVRQIVAVRMRPVVPYQHQATVPVEVQMVLSGLADTTLEFVGFTRGKHMLFALPGGTSEADAFEVAARLGMHRDVLWAAIASTPSADTQRRALSKRLGDSEPPEIFVRRFIVRFSDPAARQAASDGNALPSRELEIIDALFSGQARVLRPMSGGAWVFEFDVPLSARYAETFMQTLRRDERVSDAELSLLLKAQAQVLPNDPYFYSSQYNLTAVTRNPFNSAQLIHGIDAPGAWEITTGSSTAVVAVVDTGVLPNHPDLAGRLLIGYDFVDRRLGGFDTGNFCTQKGEASSWHGSHVAGIIGAAANNGLGVTGIDWRAAILPVRVLGKCGGAAEDIIDGMLWAAGVSVPGVPRNPAPARVINLSLGGPGTCSRLWQDAIDEVMAAGAVVVVAAGNEDTTYDTVFPASCNGVVTVAASDAIGNKASYSNYGTTTLVPDLAAPGGDTVRHGYDWGIWSLGNTGLTVPLSNTFVSLDGTSMAAPHVAGVASLMLAANPTLSSGQVRSLLIRSARPFASYSDFRWNYPRGGQGFLDARAAVEAARDERNRASVTPASGAWAIDSELNGKPGRGLQLDVQGNILVLTVYAYDTSGRGTFYLTAGPIDSGNEFRGELLSYSGGTTFGGSFRNASVTGNLGEVKVSFTDGTRGVITFPGESPKSISRLNFGIGGDPGGLHGEWFAVSRTSRGPEAQLLRLNQTRPDSSGFSSGEVRNAADTVSCARNVDGTWQNRVVCVTGARALEAVDHIYALEYSTDSGFGSDFDVSQEDVSDLYYLRITSASGRNTGANLSGFVPRPQTFTPLPGAWAIDGELNGQPGRGMQIDVQGDILVLTVYGYDAQGRGAFYLSAGQLSREGYFAGDLNVYSGGTALGGPFKEGVLAGSAGRVEIQFHDGAHGMIRFPGEAPLAISKFRFGIPEAPNGLLGTWIFAYEENGVGRSHIAELAQLTAGNTGFAQGVAISADQRFACGRDTVGSNSFKIVCSVRASSGILTDWFFWEFSGNHGDGVHVNALTGADVPMRAWRIEYPDGRRTSAFAN